MLDGLPPLPALLVAGTLTSVLAGGVLVLLDARVREELSTLWNRIWRRSTAAVGTPL